MAKETFLVNWLKEDITWCARKCSDKKCFRNIANKRIKKGLMSVGDMYDETKCPKDAELPKIFEEKLLETKVKYPDWLLRVIDEKAELVNKLEKLTKFVYDHSRETCEQYDLLLAQYYAMDMYISILSERITAWETKNVKKGEEKNEK